MKTKHPNAHAQITRPPPPLPSLPPHPSYPHPREPSPQHIHHEMLKSNLCYIDKHRMG